MHPAHRAFQRWLRGKEFALVGQVWIRVGRRFELRHERDSDVASLETFRGPAAARERAVFTDAGKFRPLKSAPNLRRGWRIVGLSFGDLVRALDGLYPAAIVHWYEWQRDRLAVTSYRNCAARQTGMYRITTKLGVSQVRRVAACCCDRGGCLKTPVWSVHGTAGLPLERSVGCARDCLPMPCPEPCSLFMSFARKAVRLNQEESMKVNFTKSDLELIGAVLHGAVHGTLADFREGDYNDPRHPQRIRYFLKRHRALFPRERTVKRGEEE